MIKNKILTIIKIIVVINLLIFIIRKNITTIFILLFILTLLFLVDYLKRKLNYSYKLQILIYIFIISTLVGGGILNLYVKTKYFDDIMHTLSSFIIAALSISILKKITKEKNKKLTIIFALSLSMSIAAIWEITEFTIDRVLSKDMQKDTIITTINTSLQNKDNSITKEKITSLYVNNIDYIEKYGGYIDIGLYDTMEDMICALIGAILFIIKLLAEP